MREERRKKTDERRERNEEGREKKEERRKKREERRRKKREARRETREERREKRREDQLPPKSKSHFSAPFITWTAGMRTIVKSTLTHRYSVARIT